MFIEKVLDIRSLQSTSKVPLYPPSNVLVPIFTRGWRNRSKRISCQRVINTRRVNLVLMLVLLHDTFNNPTYPSLSMFLLFRIKTGPLPEIIKFYIMIYTTVAETVSCQKKGSPLNCNMSRSRG